MVLGLQWLHNGWQALMEIVPGSHKRVATSPFPQNANGHVPEIVRSGERVYLRKHAVGDRAAFLAWYQDPEIAELLRHDLAPLTRIQAQGYFDSIVMPSSARGLCWAICETADDRLIGSTAIVDKNVITGSALFRIVIGEKSRWNMGFGTEATSLVLAEAFTTHNLTQVRLEVFNHNPRAQRAYLRAGFEQVGQHAEWVSRAHRQIDVLEMVITRARWLERAELDD